MPQKWTGEIGDIKCALCTCKYSTSIGFTVVLACHHDNNHLFIVCVGEQDDFCNEGSQGTAYCTFSHLQKVWISSRSLFEYLSGVEVLLC